MAGSLNKAILIGNLGKDPEIRSTNDGREIASFSIATSETWRDKATGEKREKTEWHRIVVFNEGLVKIIKSYVKKGSKLYIEGQLQTRKWVDSDGNEKYTTEIVLQGYNGSLILMDSRGQDGASDQGMGGATNQQTSSGSAYGGNSPTSNNFESNDLDDEIPF